MPVGVLCDLAGDFAEAERAEVNDQQKHGQQEAEVADAVDNEGLDARSDSGVLFEVEADPLPSDEHEEEVLSKHQREHKEHEEVEIGEEPPVALLMCHVTDGIDMN